MSETPPEVPSGRRIGLRARLADPLVISWPTFIISSLLLSYEVLQYGLTVFALSQVFVFGLLFAARWMFLSRTYPRRHSWMMVTTIVVASLVGSITAQLLLAESDAAVGADGAFTRMIVIPAAGLLSVSLIDYRDNVRRLRTTARQLSLTRDAGLAAVTDAREAMVARIQQSLKSTLQEMSAQHPRLDAKDLSSLAQETVRPLSHELAESTPHFTPASTQPAAVRWPVVLGDVAARPLIIPWLMALAVAVISIRFTFVQSDVAVGETLTTIGPVTLSVDPQTLVASLSFLVVVFVTVWALALFAVRITRPLLPRLSSGGRWLTVTLSVLGIGIGLQVVLLVTPVLPGPLSDVQTDPIGRFWAFAPVVVIAVVLAVARTVTTARTAVIAELQTVNTELSWEIARVRLDLWAQQRRFAVGIHGPLQAAVTASALLLADASAPDRAAVIGDAHARIKTALDHVIRQHDSVVDLDSGVADIERTWDQVCDVEMTIGDEAASVLDNDDTCRQAMLLIIGESVANAAIHGKATAVHVAVVVEHAKFIHVSISDNGHGVDASSTGGLGSAILDEACGEWELINTDDGARLTAVLATSGTREDSRDDSRQTQMQA